MSRVWNAILDIDEGDTSSPVFEPITVEEFKDYALMEGFQDTDDSTPVSFDGEDDLIEYILRASREAVEKFTRLSLIPKRLIVTLTNKAGMVLLPGAPIHEIVSLTDEDGTEIDEDNYTIVGSRHKRLKSPLYENMVITYECGFSRDELPDALRLAILIDALYRFDNRGEKEGVTLCTASRIVAQGFRL